MNIITLLTNPLEVEVEVEVVPVGEREVQRRTLNSRFCSAAVFVVICNAHG